MYRTYWSKHSIDETIGNVSITIRITGLGVHAPGHAHHYTHESAL